VFDYFLRFSFMGEAERGSRQYTIRKENSACIDAYRKICRENFEQVKKEMNDYIVKEIPLSLHLLS